MNSQEKLDSTTSFFEKTEKLTRIMWGMGDLHTPKETTKKIFITKDQIISLSSIPFSRERCFIALMVYEVLKPSLEESLVFCLRGKNIDSGFFCASGDSH